MASKPKRATGSAKAPAATETSDSIEQQTRDFLKSGGSIENVPRGVSGQQSMAGPKHIRISSGAKKAPQ